MPIWVNIPALSPFLYCFRNLIEGFFNKFKHFRAVATRFDGSDANIVKFRPQRFPCPLEARGWHAMDNFIGIAINYIGLAAVGMLYCPTRRQKIVQPEDKSSRFRMPHQAIDADPAETTLGIAPQCFPVRIYYEDTDFSGFVYHASYLRFLERGRTELLRTHGIEHSRQMESGVYFVVRTMTIEFLKPALMDDELCVLTQIAALHGASLDIWQEIRRDRALLLTAKVKIALIAGGKACRIPETLRTRLRARAQSGSRNPALAENQGA